MDVITDFLKTIPYYAGLGQPELDLLRNFTFETAVARGEMVLVEGEVNAVLYMVASGVMKVFKTSTEGKEQIISLVRTGEAFNDVPVFDGGVNPFSAQAMTPVTLYGIRQADLETVFRQHPIAMQNVVKVLAGRVRNMMALVEDLSFRPVISRVARILYEQAIDISPTKPKLTQQEMAAMAGTAREMIGRSLKSLEENQAIRLDRHRIIITNKNLLREMAGIT